MYKIISSKIFMFSLHIKEKKRKYNYKYYILTLVISLLVILNLEDFNLISKKLLICLCAIGKKENLYAQEYIEHYKNLGYDKIFIYDNNDINDEKFEDVLSKEISNNFVQIINFRGFKRAQVKAYYDCYQKNSRRYDWISFFDFDEFLELKNNQSIKDFLKDIKFKKCDNIKINWVIFSDNNLVHYDNRKIQKRFSEPLFYTPINNHIKSTVRGNMKINYWSIAVNPHLSKVKVISCTPSGQRILDYDSPFLTPPRYDFAYIKHYHTKTIEEYINKIKRGWYNSVIKPNNLDFKKRLNFFFSINRKTNEKLKYVNDTLNISYI